MYILLGVIDDKNALYVDVPDADEYTSIEDDHNYEQPVKILSNGTLDMSKVGMISI